MKFLYNHYKSKKKSINEEALFNLINDILNYERLNKYEIFGNDEKFYFQDYLNKFESIEEIKLNKIEKFKNIVENIESNKENKFISIEELNKLISTKEQNTKEKQDKFLEIINKYCNKYLKSKNVNNKDNINLIVSKINELKTKEDTYIKYYNNKSNNNSSNEKITKLNIKRIKKNSKYIGLRNLGTLCYINSVIQQLYMIPQFRNSILDVDDKKEPEKSEVLNDDNILHQLQKLFTYLSYTSYGEVIPKDFIISIKDYKGKPISFKKTEDSNEFFIKFCDKIEKKIKYTKYKYLIENLFSGMFCYRNICSSCNNVYYSKEKFANITLDVQGINNINESLENYMSEQSIDDFKCSNCNQYVTLKKATYISRLPNILIINLKRIIYNIYGNQEKINSRFEFPKTLNLKNYCIENNIKEEESKENNYTKKKDEYYNYELKGVNIHKGSAKGGHYTSIIKVDKNNWYKFDDSKVEKFDVKNLGEECYGGYGGMKKDDQKKLNSAYFLVYELSKKKPIKIALNENEINKIKKENCINVE